jgi:uncharacterized membrane protein
VDWLPLLKLIHIASAIVAVGANVTYAYWLRVAGNDPDRLRYTITAIRGLDRRMANPAYGIVLITGLLMVLVGAYPLTAAWVLAALGLYGLVALAGMVLYAPAIRRQLTLAANPSSDAYRAAAARSNLLGAVTLAIVTFILILMVLRPA